MKRQELNALKQKSEKELAGMITQARLEITKLRLEMAMRKTKNVSAIGQKKITIAQIHTLLNERKVQND